MSRIIAIVTTDLNYDQRMIRICGAMQEKGHEVTLVGRLKPNSPKLVSRSYEQRRFSTIWSSGPIFYAIYNLRVCLWLIIQKTDVIYAVDYDTLLAATVVSKLKNCKLVFDAHEWFEELPELTGRSFVKRIWKTIGKYGIRHAHRCITVNKALAERLEVLYQKPFEVVRNVPVYMPDQKFLQKEERTIIYQGAINKGRQLFLLIDALEKLPRWKCYLVGDGDEVFALKRYAEKKALKDRVIFMGSRTPEFLRGFTPKAQLGYNLLEGESLNYYYSLANKFFDYMHAGVPSISPAFPAYMSFLASTNVGYTLAEQQVDHLVTLIMEIEKNQDVYQAKSKRSREIAKEVNWQEESKNLLTAIEF